MAASMMRVNSPRPLLVNFIWRSKNAKQAHNFYCRNLTTIRHYCEEKSKPHDDSRMSAPVLMHHPSKLDKWILVWTKKYPSISEVPETIKWETMGTAKDKARIYFSLVMAAFTIVGCFIMIFSGKAAARRGETVAKRNLDWHNKINEK